MAPRLAVGAVFGPTPLALEFERAGHIVRPVDAEADPGAIAQVDLVLLDAPADQVRLAAGLLARLPRLPAICAVVLVALLGWPVQVDYRQPDGHSQATSQVRTVIAPRFEPGDVVVYGDNHRSIPWSPRDMVAYYLPRDRTPADALLVRPQRAGGHFLAVETRDVATKLANADRVWVVRVESPADPRAGLGAAKSDYLTAHYRVVQTWRSRLVVIALLERT